MAKAAGAMRHLAHRMRSERPGHVVRGAKALIAALLAWGVAAPWSPGGSPYLAVATALLMVNASTVYQSVTKAAQNVVAKLAGLVLALATAWLFGVTMRQRRRHRGRRGARRASP